MCLSVPGKVLTIDDQSARVDVDGMVVDCNLMVLQDEDVAVGDYVLIHAGFAIQKYELGEALELLRLLRDALHADS